MGWADRGKYDDQKVAAEKIKELVGLAIITMTKNKDA
jgi:hypothetical protein